MPSIIIYLLLILLGFVIQTILQSPTRMIVDIIIGIMSGFSLIVFSTFLPLAFVVGMMIRVLIGGYWNCFVMMIVYVGAGVLIGFVF